MSERFNILMCEFHKFYICAVVGVVIEQEDEFYVLLSGIFYSAWIFVMFSQIPSPKTCNIFCIVSR